MLLRTLFLFCPFMTVQSKFTLYGPALYQLTAPVDHAASPVWDQNRTLLFFTDSYNGRIYCFDPKTQTNSSAGLNGTAFSIIATKDPNIFIASVNSSMTAIDWDGISPTIRKHQILATLGEKTIDTLIHEGKSDKNGRIWFGTKSASTNGGTLYKITRENATPLQTVLASVDITGLTWIGDKFFHIESSSHQITQYDFDNVAGVIRDPQIVYDFVENDIHFKPFGMTGDVDGNLWVALYGGGRIVKIDPNKGELLQSVSIPAQYVTSVAFGGDDLDILFVTTSRHELSQKQKDQQPSAGAVFALSGLGTIGSTAYESELIDYV